MENLVSPTPTSEELLSNNFLINELFFFNDLVLENQHTKVWIPMFIYTLPTINDLIYFYFFKFFIYVTYKSWFCIPSLLLFPLLTSHLNPQSSLLHLHSERGQGSLGSQQSMACHCWGRTKFNPMHKDWQDIPEWWIGPQNTVQAPGKGLDPTVIASQTD